MVFQETAAQYKGRREVYMPGSLVYLFDSQPKPGVTRKLDPMWHGPFIIRREVHDTHFEVQEVDVTEPRTLTVHVTQMMLCRGNKTVYPAPAGIAELNKWKDRLQSACDEEIIFR